LTSSALTSSLPMQDIRGLHRQRTGMSKHEM
jgi:hypothetical protein